MTVPSAPTAPRRLQLGVLTFVPSAGPGAQAARQGLEDGLRLVELAEDLGYDAAWVRNRHFEPFLSSPLVFLAAAAARTRRIRLGTGVVPVRYEDPVRLAEDALTLDLLSGGRLELGLSTGIATTAAVLDPVFGASERGFAAESAARAQRLRDAVAGRSLGTSAAPLMSLPAGSELVVTPASPGLAQRVWWGAGSTASAERTGRDGMDLQVSTLSTEDTGEPFDVAQAAQVRAFRAAAATSGRAAAAAADGSPWAPRASAGRILLPLLDEADERAHADFLDGYGTRMRPDGRPRDAGSPAVRAAAGPSVVFSPALAGDPDAITTALLGDAVLGEVDQLVVTLPAPGGAAAHRRVLRAVAERVAPELGWSPAA